jgi:hypothetical protein
MEKDMEDECGSGKKWVVTMEVDNTAASTGSAFTKEQILAFFESVTISDTPTRVLSVRETGEEQF